MPNREPKRLVLTNWDCACGACGTLRVSPDESGASYFDRIIEVHKLSSPYCRLKQIGIGPDALLPTKSNVRCAEVASEGGGATVLPFITGLDNVRSAGAQTLKTKEEK
jgi:hypothetical protein